MIKEFVGRILYIVPNHPKTVQISITNVCNFNCKMCQRYDLKVDLKPMSLELFKDITNKLGAIENVILTGWGEPLTHPDVIEMVKLCKQKGWNVRFTSNGNLLNDKMMDNLIEAGLDAITFSLDAINVDDAALGHPVKEQLENIKTLQKKIKDKKSKLKIYLQSMYHKGKKQDLFDVVNFAKEIKVDRVRLSRLDVRFHDFDRPTFKEEKEIIKEIESLLVGTKIGLDFLPHQALDGVAKLIMKIFYPVLHRFGKYCLRTYNDVYINVNGEVTPCCALPKLNLGDLKKDNLNTIWNNVNFKRFRIKQAIACGKCDVLKVKPFNKD